MPSSKSSAETVKRCFFALTLSLCLAKSPLALSETNSGSDLDALSRGTLIYTQMVEAMKTESPPKVISYDEIFSPDGLRVSIEAAGRGEPRPTLLFNPDREQIVFKVVQRAASGFADVVDVHTGNTYSGSSIFWSPTWKSLHAYQGKVSSESAAPATSAPITAASIEPQSDSATQRSVLQVIGDVMVANDNHYRIEYVGIQDIDGSATDHLHLTPRSNPDAWPLTDLYVSQQSHLLQAVSARFKDDAGISGYSGTTTYRFGRIGPFWIVIGGSIAASAHVFFTHSKGTISFSISNVKYGDE